MQPCTRTATGACTCTQRVGMGTPATGATARRGERDGHRRAIPSMPRSHKERTGTPATGLGSTTASHATCESRAQPGTTEACDRVWGGRTACAQAPSQTPRRKARQQTQWQRGWRSMPGPCRSEAGPLGTTLPWPWPRCRPRTATYHCTPPNTHGRMIRDRVPLLHITYL